MKVNYDPQADALNIEFREGEVDETLEITPDVMLDVDKESRPLYLEILGAKEKLGDENSQEITLSLPAEPAEA